MLSPKILILQSVGGGVGGSVMLHISGTVHHMIVIYGNFCKMIILIFWVVSGVKGQKIV